MATQAQIAAFANQYGSAATDAGNTLGVAPSTILSQWAYESGYGTNSGSAGNNLAGIMVPGTQVQQTYASPEAFEQAYVGVIKSNDPQALNTGSDTNAFVNGLAAGHYFGNGDVSAYASGVAGTGAAIQNADPATYAQLQNGGQTTTPSVTTVDPNTGFAYSPSTGSIPVTPSNPTGTYTSASGCSGTLAFLSWGCWSGVAADIAIVVVGVGVVFLAISSGIFGGASRQSL